MKHLLPGCRLIKITATVEFEDRVEGEGAIKFEILVDENDSVFDVGVLIRDRAAELLKPKLVRR